ncbi:MAG: response regulator transcription factor [Opitutae bacterium]|nr:response regulator transcription factor [Opitutae bacterium]
MKIRTLLVDDEPLAREGVAGLLRAHPEFEVVGEAENAKDARRLMRELKPELAFLDVEMPGMSGMEMLQAMPPAERPAVVFVTAFESYARPAFDVAAIDYLMKPFTDERFAEMIERVKHRLRTGRLAALDQHVEALLDRLQQTPAPAPAPAREPAPPTEKLLFRSGGEIHVLPVAEIRWVEAQGDYLKIYLAGHSVIVRESIRKFIERIPGGPFVRVHKSTVANTAWVRRVEHLVAGDYEVELRDDTRLRVSRVYRAELFQRLGYL